MGWSKEKKLLAVFFDRLPGSIQVKEATSLLICVSAFHHCLIKLKSIFCACTLHMWSYWMGTLFSLNWLHSPHFFMFSFSSNFPFSASPSLYSLVICLTIVITVCTEMTTSLHSPTSWLITECLGRNLLRNRLRKHTTAISLSAQLSHLTILPFSFPLSLCPSAFKARSLKVALWNSSSIPQPPTLIQSP